MLKTVQHSRTDFTHAQVSRRLINFVNLTDAGPHLYMSGKVKLLAAGEGKEELLKAKCVSPFSNEWSIKQHRANRMSKTCRFLTSINAIMLCHLNTLKYIEGVLMHFPI